jgi:hypothetical protein
MAITGAPGTPHSLLSLSVERRADGDGRLGNVAIYGRFGSSTARFRRAPLNVGSWHLAQVTPADLHIPSSVNWRRRSLRSEIPSKRVRWR